MKIAYVAQDQSLFARSIRENVTYGMKTSDEIAVPDDKIVWDALKMANIDQWVASLPNGLDTELVDGENMVSGGQLQRLHLAHLFCTCPDADLVLLDECLSALDQNSRDLLIDRLETFLHGKTAILVTHHSEMLRMCNVVHDMSPSAIAENLANNNPAYTAGPLTQSGSGDDREEIYFPHKVMEI